MQTREIGSNTIIKGHIDENLLIIPITKKNVTLVNFSRENSERLLDIKIIFANALWGII